MSNEQDIPFDTLKTNCKEFISEHSNGKRILRLTDGKKTYEQISRELGLPRTSVSTILNIAKKLHLVDRIKPGVFKKRRGVMSHIPEGEQKKKSAPSIGQIIEKAKKVRKFPEIKEHLFSSLPLANIDKMTIGYRNLYIVENTLRELIRKALGKEVNGWWNQRVNEGIRNSVKEAIDNYPYHGYQRKDELEYTHLGQLKEIIVAKNNWNNFLPYLKEQNKASFSATIEKAIPSRNSIGHCIPLKSEDLRYVDMRFQDILKMLK